MGERDQQADSRSEAVDGSPFLIVGLGNPGKKYQQNRHNIGFMLIDKLAELTGIDVARVQAKALYGKGDYSGQTIFLAKPQTYMNKSGGAVNQLIRFYKIPLSNLLVVYDELDLPLGSLRLRPKGGAGGHNGMRSIIQYLGTDFPRLRLGIGRPPGQMDPAAYVLRDFKGEELLEVDQLLGRAVEAVESFIHAGVELAMTRHNVT